MERGTYISASGGLMQFRKLEVVNNNLANINTPGYKRQVLVGSSQSFDETLAKSVAAGDPYAEKDHERTPGVVNIDVATDFSAGPIKQTGNPLDVALKSDKEFFVIDTPEGQQYTRAGNFTINDEGTLVTQDGMTVIGDGGAISINGAGASISEDGSVRAGGVAVGKLQVVQFDDPSALERAGGTRFSLRPGAAQPQQVDANLISTSLEMSNSSAITSMLDLISANRGFQTYTRTAESIDILNQAAINQVGRPR